MMKYGGKVHGVITQAKIAAGILASSVLIAATLLGHQFWLPTLLEVYVWFFSYTAATYPYDNAPVYFSVGDALAAIAVLLAIYQFRKSDWEIPLEIRRWVIPTVIVLVVLGLVSASMAALTVFSALNGVLRLSILWQLMSAIFILTAIVLLFIGASRRRLFNGYSARSFTPPLLRRVSTMVPEKLDQVVDVLRANLETIFDYIRKSDSEARDAVGVSHFLVTQLLSNPTLARHIVTRRADFFERFLRSIKDLSHPAKRDISVAYNALVRAAFTDKTSFFYREIEHAAPGVYFKPFIEMVFANHEEFLQFRPLEQVGFGFREFVDSDRLNLYLETLEAALEGYFVEPNYINFEYSPYRQAFENFKNAMTGIVREASLAKSDDQNAVSAKFHNITFFLGWKFQTMYRQAVKNGHVSDVDLEARVDKRSYGIYPIALTAGYAKLIYEILCEIGEYPEKESIRFYAMTLTDSILRDYQDDLVFDNIRRVFLEFVWEQIHNNVERGHYPAVLPVYLSLVGMWVDGAKPHTKDLYNRTVEYLNTYLKPKLLENALMANDVRMEEVLLPQEVKFNRDTGEFEWQMHKGIQVMRVRK